MEVAVLHISLIRSGTHLYKYDLYADLKIWNIPDRSIRQWLKNAYANLVLRDFSPFQAREKSLGTRLAYAWENPSPPAQSYDDSLSLLVTATLTSFSWVAFFSLAMIWNKFSDKHSSANSARSRNGFSFPLALIKETQKLRNQTLQNLNAT